MKYVRAVGLVILMGLLACTTTIEAANPTPTPSPRPTPTPLPVGNNEWACVELEALVFDAREATINPRSNKQFEVSDRMALIYEYIEDDPPMKRAARSLMLATWERGGYDDGSHQHSDYYWESGGHSHSHGKSFADGVIAARQLERLCYHRGHNVMLSGIDVIMEYACIGMRASSLEDDEKVAPIARNAYFGKCQ